MKSIYFVEHGIPEYFDKKGRPVALNDEEIRHIVNPLSVDIRRNVKDDKMTLISSDTKKSKQAASILGKKLGGLKPIYRNKLSIDIEENTFEDIINLIPAHRNQVIIFGVNNLENLVYLLDCKFGNNLIKDIRPLNSRIFCPYEITEMTVTNKCLCQMKTSLAH